MKIEVGFRAFTSDGREGFGAVRDVLKNGRELVVYVENVGDFVVPTDAVVSVDSQKVTFDCKKLERKLRASIGHAHDAEDAY